MRRNVRRIIAGSLVGLFSIAADSTGARMIHIVFRHISPDIREGTYAAAPVKLWRLGTRYARLEEAPDAENGIHGLVITNEPDSWLINRYQNAGIHIVDPGPSFNVLVPIFPLRDGSELSKLEFGNESAFFRSHGAARKPDEAIDGVVCETYELKMDGELLKLHVRKDEGRPWQLSRISAKDPSTIRYEMYLNNLPPDLSLFAPPKEVVIREAPEPSTPSEDPEERPASPSIPLARAS